jgi:hypothetical protein
MNENISYDTLLGLLVGDLRSEDELAVALNFLGHAKTVIRQLYWAKMEEKMFLVNETIE